MTLLRLSPDSERLRRIAKAHAAGELSTPDYRRIRTEVIDGFGGGTLADQGGDDTQPRWVERSIAPVIKTDGQPELTAPASGSHTGTWLLALIVLLIAVVVGSTAAWAGTIPRIEQCEPNIASFDAADGPQVHPMVFAEIVPLTTQEPVVRLRREWDLD